MTGRGRSHKSTPVKFPDAPEARDSEYYLHVYSERDELDRARFVAYWRGPAPGGGPQITRGQVFYAVVDEHVRRALESGYRVFWWPSGEEVPVV